MSRKPFIAGNFGNEQKSEREAKAFVEAASKNLPSSDLVEAGIAAPADLTAVRRLKVQTPSCCTNTYFNAGAFTGETSPQKFYERNRY